MISKSKGVTDMTNYELQILKTCIQTYLNLYGVMPGTPELVEMLGSEYESIIPLYLREAA